MSPHTDAGAMLELADDLRAQIAECDFAGSHYDKKVSGLLKRADTALRQAASLGRAGGEAVAWRWRIKNSEGQHGGWEFSFTEPKFYGTPHDCEPLYALSSPVKTGGETET